MPQYIFVIGAILVFFKDFFTGIAKSKESKIFLVSIVLYFVYQWLKKKEDEANYQKLNNKAGSWAMLLHGALHPFLPVKIPLIGYFDDGTNEDTIKTVALEMGNGDKAGTNTNLEEVQNAFKVLYGDDLKESLLKDDVLELFENSYDAGLAGAKATTNTNPVLSLPPSAGASIKNTSNLLIEVGKSYIAKGGVNLRDNASPYAVKSVTKQGDVFRVYMLKKNMIINGTPYTVAFCQKTYFGVINPFENYMLIVNAFTAKA